MKAAAGHDTTVFHVRIVYPRYILQQRPVEIPLCHKRAVYGQMPCVPHDAKRSRRGSGGAGDCVFSQERREYVFKIRYIFCDGSFGNIRIAHPTIKMLHHF